MKKINRYVCERCNSSTVTENLDEGVIPASITCEKCNRTAWTEFFSCQQDLIPDLYWFKPSDTQLRNQVKWELSRLQAEDLISFEVAYNLQKEHVAIGGLILGPDLETIKKWR